MSIIDKPTDYFETKLYTGTGSELAITGVGFQPDWVWTKSRSNTLNHNVYDSVRGVNKGLKPNTNDAEFDDAQSLKSFNSDGFTVGTDSHINTSSATFASWNWKANGAASSNTDGSITSSVSANTTSGFSIVSYTGTGSAATVGHGLSTAPKMVIVKNRGTTGEWITWHTGISNQAKLSLNTTDALYNPGTGLYWNSTSPTSSVFSIGTSGSLNANTNTYIAYCFADVQGYSKFGSYTGNGNVDGPFIYTGFKPAFVLVKATTVTNENWVILDNKRDTFNPQDSSLYPNLSNAEDADGADYFDFVSNGMKPRTTNGGSNRAIPYIYMAFAENPFVTSTGVPATAR